MTQLSQSSSSQHVVLEVEVPAIYTDDLDDLREYRDGHETESEWLLNCLQLGGPVRLRVEVMGEKDSDVVEVWGHVNAAKLAAPSAGYDVGSTLTEGQLQAAGGRLLRDEHACGWCMTCPEACNG